MVFPFSWLAEAETAHYRRQAFAVELSRMGYVMSTRKREWFAEQWSLLGAVPGSGFAYLLNSQVSNALRYFNEFTVAKLTGVAVQWLVLT